MNDLNWDNFEEEIFAKNQSMEKAWGGNIEKAWSKDLKSRFPNGQWKTINGAKVFVNGGKVVAGLNGFNKELDKFFEGKKEKPSISKESLSGLEKDSKKMSVDEIKDKIEEVEKIIGSDKISNKDRVDYMKTVATLTGELANKLKRGEKSDGDKSITMDTFKDIAKQSKDVSDFMSRVRKIKNVPSKVAKEFNEKYGQGGKLSPEKASLAFMKEHGIKSGIINETINN